MTGVAADVVVQDPAGAGQVFAAALAVVRLPGTGKGWRRADLGDAAARLIAGTDPGRRWR